MATSAPTSGSMKAGSVGLKGASKALLVSFERIAAKKKKVADEATKKSTSTKEKASRTTKKSTAGDDGRGLTKCID